ncbi:MAG: phage head closure protein [Polaromonas sp.]|nr:phage head closure protein [Polaromonas sp.]
MNAGQLRHRVILQTLTVGQDEIGQPVTTWTDTATLWADVRYLSGLSAIKAGADVSLSKVSIRLRYRAINAGQRIKQGVVLYAIEAVLPDAKRVFVDLVCAVVA